MADQSDYEHSLYRKYVENSALYRVVPEWQVADIRRCGLDPDYDPFTEVREDLLALFALVLELKDQGFLMMYWWGRWIDQEEMAKCSIKDLSHSHLYFCRHQHHVEYFKKLYGGALVTAAHLVTNELIQKQIPLSFAQEGLVERLSKWAHEKRTPMVVLEISSADPVFESAIFQADGEHPSPFGSQENWRRAMSERGMEFYKPFLEGERDFYLRVTLPVAVGRLIFLS